MYAPGGRSASPASSASTALEQRRPPPSCSICWGRPRPAGSAGARASRLGESFSDPGGASRRRTTGEKPTAQRHLLANPARPPARTRPHWRETDSPASPSRQPRPGRPAATQAQLARNRQPSVTFSPTATRGPPRPATLARNRQPSVTFSPTEPRRHRAPPGPTGEKPTAQRHLLANPSPAPARPRPWRETDSPASPSRPSAGPDRPETGPPPKAPHGAPPGGGPPSPIS